MKAILPLLFIVFTSCSHIQNTAKPKNLVYFIGDGMGPAVVTGGRVWKYGSEGKLNVERMSHTGFSKTYSTNDYVTDSAASGTALATGKKTYNGSVGMTDAKYDASGKSRQLETLMDVAIREGKSVGIITTTRVTHATPASFYAHAMKRSMENEIADQVIASPVKFLLGGGRRHFHGKDWKDPVNGKKGKRKDSRSISKEAQMQGWTYIEKGSELKNISKLDKNQKVLGLFSHDHMAYELHRVEKKLDEPSLDEMVKWGINILKENPNGYFLIVEGGRIDHAEHRNLSEHAFMEMAMFDNAIGLALDKTDDDTLVVVTADHETGGLALSGYMPRTLVKGDGLVKLGTKMGKERGLVSWATGPASTAEGIYEDTERGIVHKATHHMRFSAHTAVDVPIIANGPGASLFTGYMNNSQIPRRILKAFGFEFESNVNDPGDLD